MDWLTPLTGIVGVVVGALTSYASTHQVQKRQLADARLAREEAERAAVVAANAGALTALLGYVRKMPPDSTLVDVPSAAHGQLAEREQAWAKELDEYLEPARVAALEVRDEQLRTLLLDGLTWIHAWDWIDLDPYRRSREWLMQGTIQHLISCVFAWRRGDARMPEPNGAYARYKEAWEYEEERQRIEAEENEAERRGQRH
ncbi:predicted protein [Streptomyces viridosporus ATCC 14672]|uniref:Predicted protein n=1 Tax=Streptomyces viridosporus (strain ATCC 14672 / DSM 40746 / JCM 4963 / KCTC 9882 / NRRL B-12104 / FH 1290) TaxID=566461 RepID=D5ZXH1_STRV1|nr:hypothetical protein [Streptomyces viridosporus]EFE67104.1 predicted protein [Streptomyces viridosporus ATCC 14672]